MINIYLGLFAKNLYICKLIIEYKMAKKNTNLTESKALAQLIAQGMSDKKAQNITILDLRNVVGAPSSFLPQAVIANSITRAKSSATSFFISFSSN